MPTYPSVAVYKKNYTKKQKKPLNLLAKYSVWLHNCFKKAIVQKKYFDSY